jgi:hypothetical protein
LEFLQIPESCARLWESWVMYGTLR